MTDKLIKAAIKVNALSIQTPAHKELREALRDALAETTMRNNRTTDSVFWFYEDELPENYPYDEMFVRSRIIDGVRMFPTVSNSLTVQTQDVLRQALEAMERAWLWMENQADGQSKGGHATFDLMMLREERDSMQGAIKALRATLVDIDDISPECVEETAECGHNHIADVRKMVEPVGISKTETTSEPMNLAAKDDNIAPRLQPYRYTGSFGY